MLELKTYKTELPGELVSVIRESFKICFYISQYVSFNLHKLWSCPEMNPKCNLFSATLNDLQWNKGTCERFLILNHTVKCIFTLFFPSLFIREIVFISPS